MKKTRVGVVQLNTNADVERNLVQVEETVREARELGAELIVVPESFAYLGPDQGNLTIAESLDAGGPVLTRCQELARSTKSELVLGGFWERGETPARVRNACVHLAADGSIKGVYRKIHLFDVDLPGGPRLMESDTVEAGTECVVTDAPFGRLGLSVCYDLRFPELYRALVDDGAVALAVPAAFTLTTGKDHWHVLLRARAIEAQSYVLAAAQTGHHFGPRRSYGHAMIIDPWGTILAQCGEGVGVAVATIDPERVTSIRASLPSLAHRKL